MRASTASWSILFSFLTMMSGACSSRSFFSLLFLFITLRYRSFRSLVANLPPSSCTIGLRSGGMTGRTSRTIHSGLLPDSLKASTSSRRLLALSLLEPDEVLISSLSSSEREVMSISFRRSWTASAPMPALKRLWYFSL